MAAGHGDCKDWEARPAGHAHRRGKPDCRRRRQTANEVLAHEDDAAPYEADAGDDLRRDARRIEDNPARIEDVGEAVFRYEHDQRRREPDKRIGAQAGALLTDFALQADRSGQYEGECKLGELEPALPDRLSQKHSAIPRPRLRGAFLRRYGATSIPRLAKGVSQMSELPGPTLGRSFALPRWKGHGHRRPKTGV